MAFKFVLLAALVACANAGILAPAPLAYAAAPIASSVVTKVTDAEYDPHPQYSYSYDVADSITGDFKNQHETRDGDVVRGSYSLLESDGTRRTVDYAADALSGFNAIVRKEPAIAAAPVVAKAVAPVAAPVIAAPAPAFAAPALAAYAAAPAFAAPAFARPVAAAPLAYGAYGAPAFGAATAFGAPAFAKTFF